MTSHLPNHLPNHLIDALRAGSRGRDDAAFATDADGTVTTYGELWAGAARIAGALAGMGVAAGDRVAVQVEKSVAALQLYLGTVMAGAVHLPLNTAYTAAEVGYFLTDAAPRVFVCDPARHDALEPVAREAGTERVLTLDAAGEGSLTDAARGAAPPAAPVARGEGDIAAFLYTSGTTGTLEGRDADAWQPRLQRAGPARPLALHGGRRADPCAADLPHPRAVRRDQRHAGGGRPGAGAPRLRRFRGAGRPAPRDDADGGADLLRPPAGPARPDRGRGPAHAALRLRLRPDADRHASAVAGPHRPHCAGALRHDRDLHEHLEPLRGHPQARHRGPTASGGWSCA